MVGDVCRKKDTLCPGINISKVADLGDIFFLLPLPIIKIIFQVSLALLLCLKFVINLKLIHSLDFQQMSSIASLSLRLGKYSINRVKMYTYLEVCLANNKQSILYF